jgi:predicted nucleic-acid-binding protein
MIGLDTNVLLAWIVAGQSRPLPAASAYRLSVVVMAELVWVLTQRLNHTRSFACGVLADFLEAADVVIDRPSWLPWRWMNTARDPRISLITSSDTTTKTPAAARP